LRQGADDRKKASLRKWAPEFADVRGAAYLKRFF
jgi:hypothetical protein